jgi:hypothetical protein
VNNARYWLTDNFQLRFGSWDRQSVVCELEGTLDAEENYFLDPPTARCKSDSRRARSPALLLMAQATFSECEVEVPGDAREPIEWARSKAARQLGLRTSALAQVRPVGLDAQQHGAAIPRSWKVTLTPML